MNKIDEKEIFKFLDSITDIVDVKFDESYYLQLHFGFSYRASLPLISKWKEKREVEIDTTESAN
jgi:hypothetical protein